MIPKNKKSFIKSMMSQMPPPPPGGAPGGAPGMPPVPPGGTGMPPMPPPGGAEGAAGPPPEPQMENPQNMNKDGSVVFVDNGMFESPPQKGQEICLICRISNIGDKIGLTPLRIEDITSDELDEQE